MSLNFNAPLAKVIAQISPLVSPFPSQPADLLVLGERGASGLPGAAIEYF